MFESSCTPPQRSRTSETVEDFQARLDQAEREQESAHVKAIFQAQAEHERVREAAELEIHLNQLREEREQHRRDAERRIALERQKAEYLAEQQRHAEHIAWQRKEIERMQREEVERKEREERERVKRIEEERVKRAEEEQRKQAEEERKRKEEAERVAQAQAQVQVQVQAREDAKAAVTSTPAAGPAPSNSQLLAEYLRLHQRLKEFRKWIAARGKEDKTFKTITGDGRRAIRSRVAQITAGKKGFSQPLHHIKDLIQSLPTEPKYDVRKLVISASPLAKSSTEIPMPAVLLYLLNIFSKEFIKKILQESSTLRKTGDPLGICASFLFSEYTCNDIPIGDMLIAKFAKMCPVLFGATGTLKTAEGRLRLGWNPDWGYEEYLRTMLDLGSGFAIITLRNFAKVPKRKNPFPNAIFWRCLSTLLNTPPQHVTDTHLDVIKGMLEIHADKFITIYGRAAIVALQNAVQTFPAKIADKKGALKLQALPDTWRTYYGDSPV
jgi:nucleoporin GLE1